MAISEIISKEPFLNIKQNWRKRSPWNNMFFFFAVSVNKTYLIRKKNLLSLPKLVLNLVVHTGLSKPTFSHQFAS